MVTKMFVTYGFNSDRAGCYSVIEASTWDDCVSELSAVCRGRYAFTYNEEQFEGQVERYGLREVPLGPQLTITRS